MAFERRAGAEGDHRDAPLGADTHDILHLAAGLRENHCVRRLVGDQGRGVGVLLAHGRRGHEPVAEFRG
jgi:hypothetical protein